MTGPINDVEYFGNGNFEFLGKEKRKLRVGMVAGGIGITPLW